MFEGPTRFDSVTFETESIAWFNNATFKAFTSFSNAQFRGEARFQAVHVDRAFTLEGAHFARIPDFVQAHFEEAPRLDDVVIPEWSFCRLAQTRDRAIAAMYRALKRLAIQAHDHKLELDFFASELKATRGNILAFFRFCYGVLSCFGRSMVLPLLWLLASGIGFAWAYLCQHFARVAETGRVYALSSGAWLWDWLTALFTAFAHWPGAALPLTSAPPLSCLVGQETNPLRV